MATPPPAPSGLPPAGPASADLILNFANPQAAEDPVARIAPQWRDRYRDLQRFRDYLLDQHQEHQADARDIQSDVIQDEPAETGTSDLLRDYLLGKISTDQDTLYEVQEAIRRLEEGTYGTCERTGQPIPPERLQAIPWTRFTLEAQQEAERQGQAPVRSAGIGPTPASISQAPPQDWRESAAQARERERTGNDEQTEVEPD